MHGNKFLGEYELQARYDSRNSFYGKAHVREYDDCLVLCSYSTDVAMIKDGKFYLNGYYSQTTSRHIREFAKQHGFSHDKKALDECIENTRKEGITL